LGFNKGTNQPLGILPQLPITLGRKIVYLNVMVVPGPLDFNLLLERDYVYGMGAIVSTLFRVMCFPHEGRIITVDQLSFPGPNMAPSQPSSLSGPFVPMVSSPPRLIMWQPLPYLHQLTINSVMLYIMYWGHWNLISPS